ncbi:hypothetical protein ACFL5O_03145 [Myxococcota bacterium]
MIASPGSYGPIGGYGLDGYSYGSLGNAYHTPDVQSILMAAGMAPGSAALSGGGFTGGDMARLSEWAPSGRNEGHGTQTSGPYRGWASVVGTFIGHVVGDTVCTFMGCSPANAPIIGQPTQRALSEEEKIIRSLLGVASTVGVAAAGRMVGRVAGGAARGVPAAGKVGATFGPKSVGAAERVWRTLQTGGNTVKGSTAKALNEAHGLSLQSREWGRALEAMKRSEGLAPGFHQTRIIESGQVVNANTGEVIGNLLEFVP